MHAKAALMVALCLAGGAGFRRDGLTKEWNAGPIRAGAMKHAGEEGVRLRVGFGPGNLDDLFNFFGFCPGGQVLGVLLLWGLGRPKLGFSSEEITEVLGSILNPPPVPEQKIRAGEWRNSTLRTVLGLQGESCLDGLGSHGAF